MIITENVLKICFWVICRTFKWSHYVLTSLPQVSFYELHPWYSCLTYITGNFGHSFDIWLLTKITPDRDRAIFHTRSHSLMPLCILASLCPLATTRALTNQPLKKLIRFQKIQNQNVFRNIVSNFEFYKPPHISTHTHNPAPSHTMLVTPEPPCETFATYLYFPSRKSVSLMTKIV